MTRLFVLPTLMAAFVLPALSASIGYVQTTPGYPSPGVVPLSAADWTQDMYFPQFDAALGRLNEMTILLESTLTSAARVPTFGAAGTFQMKGIGHVELLTLPDLWLHPTHFGASMSSTTSQSVDANQQYAIFPEIQASTSKSWSLPASSLTGVIGMGTFHIKAYGTSNLPDAGTIACVTGPGWYCFQPDQSIAASVTVTYDYDPVPEPAYTLLIAVLSVGIIAVKRLVTERP
jgi:hypothetical protein